MKTMTEEASDQLYERWLDRIDGEKERMSEEDRITRAVSKRLKRAQESANMPINDRMRQNRRVARKMIADRKKKGEEK